MNYQKELEKVINNLGGLEVNPSLLLHSCCAPCSSYVLEYLSKYFSITIIYYNPNIFPEEEYHRRIKEQETLLKTMKLSNPVRLLQGEYHPEEYYKYIKGHEAEIEGGARCFLCYELRLKEAARLAKVGGYDYFTTTLSISPHKNSVKLNEIGEASAKEYGVKYLPSDFKKKDGYKRSIQLSREYGLYRQDYCGCVYSKGASSSEQEKI